MIQTGDWLKGQNALSEVKEETKGGRRILLYSQDSVYGR